MKQEKNLSPFTIKREEKDIKTTFPDAIETERLYPTIFNWQIEESTGGSILLIPSFIWEKKWKIFMKRKEK